MGQHFLTDRGILERIVDALDPKPDDVVIEIGAGSGTLTRVLAERVGRVVAIEKDVRLVQQLRIADPGLRNVHVVGGDALRLDWGEMIPDSAIHSPPWKVVGNIPYHITSPLIEKALTAPRPELIVFLVQAEVADRVAAAPGSKTYGALSVGVQSVCRVEKLFAVAAGSFRPPPKVHSAVIRLRPLSPPLIAPDEGERFREFVTGCFSLRRKQLRNVLRAVTGRPTEWVEGQLAALGIGITQRPETLAPEQFVRLFRAT
jgi:16S rRNA (adenine1518-N6/adenine1519-N6)-dimethyltransferase